MVSYWERKSFRDFDVIIVGGGITGLSTAIAVKELAPACRVAVLERGILPAGASLRNAGFACIGSLTEILDDLEHMDADRVARLVSMRMKGLALLRRRLGDRRIGYRERGSYELLDTSAYLDRMEEVNRLLRPVTGKDAFADASSRAGAFGFDGRRVPAMVRNVLEGELDTGRMMRALWELAGRQGVYLFTGCRVTGFEEHGQWVKVETEVPGGQPRMSFRTPRLALCTNAFTSELLAEVAIRPGRGQVLLTGPVKGLPFRGIFHFFKGYYYFRELNGRVLFGGGRNLDFTGEETTTAAVTERIQCDLEEKLHSLVLPGREFRVQQRWAGIMGFPADKFPLISRHTPRVFIAAAMGGMGIAIGSEAGRLLAEGMLHESEIIL